MVESLVVGRLAPSPTGAQHVGNARTYLLAWLAARSRGGKIALRMEDIDSPRVKPHAARQALDDLRWLGLDWDHGPDIGGPHAPYVQTERMALYQTALEQLIEQDLVYPCTCTRSDIAAAASAPHVGQEGPRYPGTCSQRSARDAPQIIDQPFAWRFRSSHQLTEFVDGVRGPQACCVAEELGDFVVAKGDGTPSYQLAVVIDDAAMGITEVVRGDDLLPSAFRQLELYRVFGFSPPRFFHVPLVVGADGRRLAKRHGDTRLAWLREQALAPERLIGWLAQRTGLIDHLAPVAPRDLLAHFAWNRVSREPYVFDAEELRQLLAWR